MDDCWHLLDMSEGLCSHPPGSRGEWPGVVFPLCCGDCCRVLLQPCDFCGRCVRWCWRPNGPQLIPVEPWLLWPQQGKWDGQTVQGCPRSRGEEILCLCSGSPLPSTFSITSWWNLTRERKPGGTLDSITRPGEGTGLEGPATTAAPAGTLVYKTSAG